MVARRVHGDPADTDRRRVAATGPRARRSPGRGSPPAARAFERPVAVTRYWPRRYAVAGYYILCYVMIIFFYYDSRIPDIRRGIGARAGRRAGTEPWLEQPTVKSDQCSAIQDTCMCVLYFLSYLHLVCRSGAIVPRSSHLCARRGPMPAGGAWPCGGVGPAGRSREPGISNNVGMNVEIRNVQVELIPRQGRVGSYRLSSKRP